MNNKLALWIKLAIGIVLFSYVLFQFYETGKEPSKWIIGVIVILLVGNTNDLTALVKAFRSGGTDSNESTEDYDNNFK